MALWGIPDFIEDVWNWGKNQVTSLWEDPECIAWKTTYNFWYTRSQQSPWREKAVFLRAEPNVLNGLTMRGKQRERSRGFLPRLFHSSARAPARQCLITMPRHRPRWARQ